MKTISYPVHNVKFVDWDLRVRIVTTAEDVVDKTRTVQTGLDDDEDASNDDHSSYNTAPPGCKVAKLIKDCGHLPNSSISLNIMAQQSRGIKFSLKCLHSICKSYCCIHVAGCQLLYLCVQPPHYCLSWVLMIISLTNWEKRKQTSSDRE